MGNLQNAYLGNLSEGHPFYLFGEKFKVISMSATSPIVMVRRVRDNMVLHFTKHDQVKVDARLVTVRRS